MGETKQSIETLFEDVQMLDLADKHFKSSILNTFKELNDTMSKGLKERIMSHQVKNKKRLKLKERTIEIWSNKGVRKQVL